MEMELLLDVTGAPAKLQALKSFCSHRCLDLYFWGPDRDAALMKSSKRSQEFVTVDTVGETHECRSRKPRDLTWHRGLGKCSWEMLLEGTGVEEHKLIN